MNERAFAAVPGNDIHALLAAFEGGGAVVQAKLAFGFFRAVAAEAILIKDGFDIAGEINPVGGWRRQFGNIHVRAQGPQTYETGGEEQTKVPELHQAVWRGIQ